MKILAIDPGEKCGWAHGTITPGAKRPLKITGHGITALKPFALKLYEAFGSYDVVVYENFRLNATAARKLTGSDMQTSQFIGMVRLCSWLNPGTRLAVQTPSDKATGSKVAAGIPQAQKILNALPARHDDAHDGDAVLHLVVYWFEHYA